VRSFNVICPFCEDIYPFPDNIDKIYKCCCGAVYKVTWRYAMEDAVGQLVKNFSKDGDLAKDGSKDNILCQIVIYEDIQNLIRMKMEYEAVKYIRPAQSFYQDFPQKMGLVWLGNYKTKDDLL